MNPYEAPQTVAKAAPPEVPRLDPDLGVLQGAQYCARGGKFLMAAAISQFLFIGVIVWIQQQKQLRPTELMKLCGWIFLSASWLLLLVGAVLNLIGYARFIGYLDHELLVKLFRDCRRAARVKFGLVLAFIGCASMAAHNRPFAIAGVTVLALFGALVLHSYFAHAKAMLIWSEHFPDLYSMKVRGVYRASGLIATLIAIGLIAFSIQQAQEPSNILLMGLMLLFALSFAAFADFYSRLSKALRASEVEAIDAATAERGP